MRNWKEQDLFDFLKQNYLPDLVKAKNQMSRWDCYSPKHKMRIELKCRRRHYPTLLIEKKKYDAMISESAKHNDIPSYINSTPKGIYFFDLSKVNPQWEINSRNPATTYWGGSKIEKEVAYLHISQAREIKTK